MNMDDKCYRFVFKDLQPGLNGLDGDDGVSPTVEVEEIENGHRLIITDVDGEKNPVDILNGDDGFSPMVTVEPEVSGHLITITDAEGEESFHVTNGLTPMLSHHALTDFMLGQSSDNLMDLVPGSVPGELPAVRLTGNRVTELGLSSSVSGVERCFLISGTPRYLPNAEADLTQDDFIVFNYDHARNLYCRVSGMVQSFGAHNDDFTPQIIVCARPTNQSETLITTCSLKCGAGGSGVMQFGDTVFPVEDGDLRHESLALKVAVLLVLKPSFQNCDITTEFYFGQIDFDSELTQNGNVIGSYNNSMYAEKAYRENDLIIRNDMLYKANWNIDRGNRMDDDYDISKTTVSDELKELRARLEALERRG